jgi:hypothetical protein
MADRSHGGANKTPATKSPQIGSPARSRHECKGQRMQTLYPRAQQEDPGGRHGRVHRGRECLTSRRRTVGARRLVRRRACFVLRADERRDRFVAEKGVMNQLSGIRHTDRHQAAPVQSAAAADRTIFQARQREHRRKVRGQPIRRQITYGQRRLEFGPR